VSTADVSIPREAVDAGARAIMRSAYAGDDSQWDKLLPTQQHIVRERAMEVLNAAAPLIVAAELDRAKTELERLAAARDAIAGDDDEPDEDNECTDECHTAGALATYARVISRLSSRSRELRAQS
jgi:hypothetical protein